MFDLTGKTALVTGATGGIGAGVARALHAQGATVAITGRRAAELEALAAELGARVIVAPADLADPEAPAKLVEKIETEAGILRETTGRQRGRLFAYGRYLDILSRGTEPLPPERRMA